ncbi:hypothetical protein BDR26DRAFT_849814 [Obelidium mucronatum]|nr:hypothetical protein BDR26DRAFT_849814 [Obelidium mucronatum]
MEKVEKHMLSACFSNNNEMIHQIQKQTTTTTTNTSKKGMENPTPVSSRFVLNVPSQQQSDLVLQVGACSGRNQDKFVTLGLDERICLPGGFEAGGIVSMDSESSSGYTESRFSRAQAVVQQQAAEAVTAAGNTPTTRKKPKLDDKELYIQQGLIALNMCVAHLVCRVEEVFERHGHLILMCVIEAGWVKHEYWNGKNFAPIQQVAGGETVTEKEEDPVMLVDQKDELNQVRRRRPPSYLSFLGSQVFATVEPCARRQG